MSTIFSTTHRIVYYQGDESRLSIAEVSPGEEGDYAMASSVVFEGTAEGEQEAAEHCRELARKYEKRTRGLPQCCLIELFTNT